MQPSELEQRLQRQGSTIRQGILLSVHITPDLLGDHNGSIHSRCALLPTYPLGNSGWPKLSQFSLRAPQSVKPVTQ
jgi:hypothetical protein